METNPITLMEQFEAGGITVREYADRWQYDDDCQDHESAASDIARVLATRDCTTSTRALEKAAYLLAKVCGKPGTRGLAGYEYIEGGHVDVALMLMREHYNAVIGSLFADDETSTNRAQFDTGIGALRAAADLYGFAYGAGPFDSQGGEIDKLTTAALQYMREAVVWAAANTLDSAAEQAVGLQSWDEVEADSSDNEEGR